MNTVNRFCGIKIIENPFMDKDIQTIKLSDSFKWCSDEFRRKQNAYLKDRFGTQLYFLTTDDMLISHPSNIAILRNQLEQGRM